MTKKASDITQRVLAKLNDLDAVRWPEAEILDAINDGQVIIMESMPDMFEHHADAPVIAGTRQDVPEDCYLLFDVESFTDTTQPRNNGTLTKIDRTIMDRQRPGWLGMRTEKTPEHWIQGDEQRKHFYIVPPVEPAGKTVRLRYARYPVKVNTTEDALSVPDEQINAMYYFVMMRLLEKDEKFSGSPQAERFAGLFSATLAGRQEAEEKSNAKRRVKEESS